MHNAKDAFPTLAYVPSALEACQDVDVVLHMTEWEEFRALRPADLAPIVRERNMIDGRNVLDLYQWRGRVAVPRPRASVVGRDDPPLTTGHWL